jgi:hypothetical protein
MRMIAKDKKAVDLAFLKAQGFKRIGQWKLGKRQMLELPDRFPKKQPAVYLFTIGAKIRYVGKSEDIQGRVKQYKKGLLKGNLKIDHGVRDAFNKGDEVSIYTLTISSRKQIFVRNGLPIDHLSGLESGLIKLLKPEWNGRRKKSVLSSSIHEVKV